MYMSLIVKILIIAYHLSIQYGLVYRILALNERKHQCNTKCMNIVNVS